MEKRKKITPLQRARQAASRVNALQAVSGYQRKMSAKRTTSVKKALLDLQERKVPPVAWPQEVNYTEPWMRPLLTDIYRTDGMLSAVEVANRLLSRKSGVGDVFARAILEWCAAHLGERISLMTDTVNKWLRETLQEIYEGVSYINGVEVPNSSLGVEQLTRMMKGETEERFVDINKWQVRRIVHTESMKSMNIAGRVAADTLGIDYEKTWSIAGINTRESHEAVDGMTVGKGEYFTVGGFPMEEPMDERFGAPAGEIINCSCTVIYLPVDNGLTEL